MVNTKYLGIMAVVFGLARTAIALPQDPSVVNGQVQVNSAAGLMQILQSSPQAIINWGSFNIRPDEIVRFLQPNQMSLILNRVTGMDPSVLEGLLQANGRVFLINPNGILVQSGARLDVGSFMASTLNMSDQDFLAGNFRLQQQNDRPMAALVNNGSIQVSDGGFVVLTSPLLHNAGVILAQSGEVRLGATSQATFSVDGQGLLHFSVPDGFTHDFRNTSPGGTVALSPGQMSQMLAQAVTSPAIQEAPELPPEGLLVHSGRIEAGSIRLDSSRATVTSADSQLSGADVRVLSAGLSQSEGRISAPGGFVEVSGREIGLHGPVDVRGGHLLIDPENLQLVDGPGTRTPPILAGADMGTTQTVDTGVISASMGTVTLQATNNVTYLDTLTGFQAPNADLAISAGNNVEFSAHIGPGFFDPSRDLNIHANSLNIAAPNVTFSSQGTGGVNITTNGDFRVNSANDITANNARNLIAGGNLSMIAGNNLTINGAGNVIAGSTGNLTLSGQNLTIPSTRLISLQGGNVSLTGSRNLSIDLQNIGSQVMSINATAGNVDIEGGNLTFTTRDSAPMRLSATDRVLVNATNDLVFNGSTFSAGDANSQLVLTGVNSTLHADRDLLTNVTTVNSTGALRLDAGRDVWMRRTANGGTNVNVTAPSIDINALGVINITNGSSFALNATAGNLSLVSAGTQGLVTIGTTARLDAAGNILISGSFVGVNVPRFSANATGDVEVRNLSSFGDVNLSAGNNLLIHTLSSPNNPNSDFDLRGGNITLDSFQGVTGINNLTLTTPGALRDLTTTSNGTNQNIRNLNITAGSIAGTGNFDGFAVPNSTITPPQVTVTGGNVINLPQPAAASLLQLQGSTIQLTTIPNQTGDIYIDGSLVGGGGPPVPPPAPGPPPGPPPTPPDPNTPNPTPAAAALSNQNSNQQTGLSADQRAELLNQVAQSNAYLGNRTGLSDVLSQTQRDRITQVATTTDVLSPTLSVVLSRNLDPMTAKDRKFFDGLSVFVSDETREKKNVAYATMVDQEVREIWEVHYWRRLIEGMVLWEESH